MSAQNAYEPPPIKVYEGFKRVTGDAGSALEIPCSFFPWYLCMGIEHRPKDFSQRELMGAPKIYKKASKAYRGLWVCT